MTKIVLNLEDNKSFLMKSIEMKFHSCYKLKPLELGKRITLVLEKYKRT